MAGYKIESERKDVNPSIYINADGKVYVDRFDRDGGVLHNNSGDSRYDSMTYSLDRYGNLKLTTAEGYTYDVKDRTVPVATPPVPKVEDTGGKGDGIELYKALLGSGSASGGGVNAISYGDYLKNYGVDTKKAYSEAVRQANSDYYRALMTYGKNAEMLAGAGLTGAGVSDYGNAAAYAARQGAVATAGAAKMETDAKQAASYAEYLQNLKAQQEAEAKAARAEKMNLITSMMTLGDRDAALGMLNAYGFTNEAEYNSAYNAINSYYDGVDKKAEEQTAAQALAEATALYEKYIADNNSPEWIESALKNAGYSDDVIKSVMSTQQGKVADQIQTEINTRLVNKDYSVAVDGQFIGKNDLDMLVEQNMLEAGSEEYNNKLAQIQAKNAESLTNLIEGAHNDGKRYNIEEVCEEFNIQYLEDDEETTGTAVVKAIRERAEELYNAGDISEEAYVSYLEKDLLYAIDGSIDDKFALRDVCGTLVQLSDYTDNIEGVGEDVLLSLIELAVQKSGMTLSEKYKRETIAYAAHTEYCITINGNTIQFDMTPTGTSNEIQENDVVGAYGNLSVLKDGRIGFTFEHNGKKYFNGLRPSKMIDYSDDQRDILGMMIGSYIVNNK